MLAPRAGRKIVSCCSILATCASAVAKLTRRKYDTAFGPQMAPEETTLAGAGEAAGPSTAPQDTAATASESKAPERPSDADIISQEVSCLQMSRAPHSAFCLTMLLSLCQRVLTVAFCSYVQNAIR